MTLLLLLIVSLPLAAFAVLIAGTGSGTKRSGIIGTAGVTASALCAVVAAVRFLHASPATGLWTATAWRWIAAGQLRIDLAVRFDALSCVMVLVITTVASLIMLYSVSYMAGERDYRRFFAFMCLFVASMLLLVMADDLLALFLGWEGVGLCSYLLIGFWYHDETAVAAARKAFVMTRIGDAALLLAIVIVAVHFGTLRIESVIAAAARQWPAGGVLPVAVASLILLGAVGKSAQLPLQTWLPDAMAGPTPVSALIHAATMVTAGVYLIARLHDLFDLAPLVERGIAIIGAATLLMAAFAALAERDLKRVLAWSTMSQIGYMFLALGAGAWTAAIFHFVTHAFFKALLFLAAGVVIHRMGGERDLLKMGGLRKELPVTFVCFAVGVCSLAALPLVTAGFYSKELILSGAASAVTNGAALWTCGIVGAFVTVLYSFRMLFLVFYGKREPDPAPEGGIAILLPVVALSVGALTLGFLETPPALGGIRIFSNYFIPLFGLPRSFEIPAAQGILLLLFAALIPLIGLLFAWQLYLRNPRIPGRLVRLPVLRQAHALCAAGFAFDAIYSKAVVRPFLGALMRNQKDGSAIYAPLLARLAVAANALLCRTQNGRVRFSVLGIVLGAAFLLAIGIFS
jgi:NADH-quinone oxidoreductase subunit L